MKQTVKLGLMRLVSLQVGLAMLIVGFCLLCWGGKAAYSSLLGSMIYLLPSLYFALKLFKHSGAQQVRKIVQAFYVGEAVKLAVSMVLFSLVFIFVPINAKVFFISYVVMHCSHWLAPRYVKTR